MLASIETKKGKSTLSLLKGKRNASEATPMETALREFNEESRGELKMLTAADLVAEQWFHVANGKMIFYWFDAGSTALLDEGSTRVLWVPVKAPRGRAPRRVVPVLSRGARGTRRVAGAG